MREQSSIKFHSQQINANQSLHSWQTAFNDSVPLVSSVIPQRMKWFVANYSKLYKLKLSLFLDVTSAPSLHPCTFCFCTSWCENRMFPISKVPCWLIAWIWRPYCHPLSLLYLLSIPLGILQCFLLALMCLCVFRVTGSITFDLRRDVLSPKSLVQSTSHCTKVNLPFTREKFIELCMGVLRPCGKEVEMEDTWLHREKLSEEKAETHQGLRGDRTGEDQYHGQGWSNFMIWLLFPSNHERV